MSAIDDTTGEVAPERSPLVEAVCAVMRDVGTVTGTGKTSSGPRFDYTSIDDVLEAVQPAMAQHGLALIPTAVQVDQAVWEKWDDKAGKKVHAGFLVNVLVTYSLCHVGGETQVVAAPGTGQDSLDKAASKAMTDAYKCAVKEVFALPTAKGGDGNRHRSQPSRYAPPPDAPKLRAELDRKCSETLNRLAERGLTPKLSPEERKLVKQRAWGRRLADLTGEDCQWHLRELSRIKDENFATWILETIGADA